MTEPNDPFSVPDQPSGQQPPPPPPGYGPPPPQYGAPPPGYGAQPPGFGQPQFPPYAMGQKTNTLAIVALVAIFVCTPAALVFGIIARNQIKQTGEGGSGMALAGIIVGGVSVAFFALLLLFVVVGASMATTPM